jgi:hypothetical protein
MGPAALEILESPGLSMSVWIERGVDAPVPTFPANMPKTPPGVVTDRWDPDPVAELPLEGISLKDDPPPPGPVDAESR